MERNSPDHKRYLKRSIASARNSPEFPLGAVLVDFRRAQIVAQGYNRTANNPTWHEETDAINRYSEQLERKQLQLRHLDTTAEPCCMCRGAILWAEIPLVVNGTSIERLSSWAGRKSTSTPTKSPAGRLLQTVRVSEVSWRKRMVAYSRRPLNCGSPTRRKVLDFRTGYQSAYWRNRVRRRRLVAKIGAAMLSNSTADQSAHLTNV